MASIASRGISEIPQAIESTTVQTATKDGAQQEASGFSPHNIVPNASNAFSSLQGGLPSFGHHAIGATQTASQDAQTANTTNNANDATSSNQLASSNQSATSSQQSQNSAAAGVQTNQQNADAANANQAVSDQSNHNLEQEKLDAALETARHAGVEDAIGSMAAQ